MNLTFLGFLRGYCRELTGLETDSLKKLCQAAAANQPAAAEAVMAFAAAKGKERYLLSLAKGTRLEEEYSSVVSSLSRFKKAENWIQSDHAPDRYRKIWLAYQAKKGAAETDRRVILLMRGKTLEAMKAAGLTTYRICKELDLNLGNAYAYLGKADPAKVSRSTARKIMDYALKAEQDQSNQSGGNYGLRTSTDLAM